MSNLFYRGGVREGSNLFILKEAKKNYMGQFIFSRGGGDLFAYSSAKKKIHNTLVATFNIMAIIISFK